MYMYINHSSHPSPSTPYTTHTHTHSHTLMPRTHTCTQSSYVTRVITNSFAHDPLSSTAYPRHSWKLGMLDDYIPHTYTDPCVSLCTHDTCTLTPYPSNWNTWLIVIELPNLYHLARLGIATICLIISNDRGRSHIWKLYIHWKQNGEMIVIKTMEGMD